MGNPSIRCCQCSGEIVFGTPHEMMVNDKPTFWCAECIEEYSQAVWPEDTFGPRAPQMHPVQSRRPS